MNSNGSKLLGEHRKKALASASAFFQLSLPLRASEVAFGSDVHCVREVSPFGEVANLTSLRPQGATSLCEA
jgi:hypothetical protein